MLGYHTTVWEEINMDRRVFNPTINGEWIGNGISYGAYRDGEQPDIGQYTSKEHILEDLLILSEKWNLIRLYGAEKQSRRIIEVIHEHDLPIRVMQGAWIDGKKSWEENDAQIAETIALAIQYSEIIVAVNIGNEIFVDWSWHRIDDMDRVIGYIRDTRAQITQPVTVNDDYNFWNKPHAQKIVDEIDFIGLHAYAFWNNQPLNTAMEWTIDIYNDIQSRYSSMAVALCESGWPTSRIYDESHEGTLVGVAGEDQQRAFFAAYDAWVEENKINALYFEAFDEQWKGGMDGEKALDKAEKHWGVYNSDRTGKKVIKTIFAEIAQQ